MGDDSRDLEAGWEDLGEDLEVSPFDDKTPDKLTPETEAAEPEPTEPEPTAFFEDEGDTVFDGDQPTVDYLEDEVPDHVADFLGESARPPGEVIVPQPGPEDEVSSVERFPTHGDDGPALQPANLTLILLVIGVVVAVAAVIYAAFI